MTKKDLDYLKKNEPWKYDDLHGSDYCDKTDNGAGFIGIPVFGFLLFIAWVIWKLTV